MEILSFPVGLVLGVVPVVVSLSPSESPAKLMLDGKEQCTLTWQVRECRVDLGPQPQVHLLELIDAKGDRVFRWINHPCSGPEVFVRLEKEPAGWWVTWGTGHPTKLAPSEAWLGSGEFVARITPGKRLLLPKAVLASGWFYLRALFPDGSAGERLVFFQDRGFLDSAAAVLGRLLVRCDQNCTLSASLVNFKVRIGEPVSPLVAVVGHPATLQAWLGKAWSVTGEVFFSRGRQEVGILAKSLPDLGAVIAVGATDELPAVYRSIGSGAPLPHHSDLLQLLSRMPFKSRHEPRRLLDAAAIAAFRAAAWPGPRALVLFVGNEKDKSRVSWKGLQDYLRQVQVPIHLWVVGTGPAHFEGKGRNVVRPRALQEAAAALAHDLRTQRLLWLEGDVRPWELPLELSGGIRVVGAE